MTGANEVLTAQEWLVGESGVWAGHPGGDWRRHCNYPFPVHGLCRAAESLLVGTGYGLWEAFPDPARRQVKVISPIKNIPSLLELSLHLHQSLKLPLCLLSQQAA